MTDGSSAVLARRRSLPCFVDLLLTWDLDMRMPRGEAGRMALITIRNLVSGVGFEPTTFML